MHVNEPAGGTPAWWTAASAPVDQDAYNAALQHQNRLTKPAGSLGKLEDIAARLAALQGTLHPRLEQVRIVVFAGDHGVVEEGVSAYPQSVTAEMVRNFARGGAAINVLAQALNAELDVVDIGVAGELGVLPGVMSQRVARGTANMCKTTAMSETQLHAALAAGREAADRAGGAQLFIGGEMGIGNTTAATAVACALLEVPPAALAGPGTGLDRDGVARKAAVIGRALALHAPRPDDALAVLRCVGGFEIAALAGAYLRCAQRGVAVLVDGFISCVAALAAVRLRPDSLQWMFFSHRSAEPGALMVMRGIPGEPLLDLGMRLGEGSGAAVAVPLMRMAVALHAKMATFAEAGVSERGDGS